MDQSPLLKRDLPPARNANQRFGVIPEYRLLAIAAASSIFGIFDGFYRGFNNAALVYLAENSHRLPKTVGGWYFYHKRKNYVCIKSGLVNGAKFSTKLTAFIMGYFSLETWMDQVRGKIDFMNTMATTAIMAGAFARFKKFNRIQTVLMIKKGSIIGLVSGLAQDAYIYSNGGKVWWIESITN